MWYSLPSRLMNTSTLCDSALTTLTPTVQAAAERVVFIVEFTAGVQAGEDEFDAGDFFFGMNIHRHAATIIADLAATVGMQGHADTFGVAGQCFVHRIVDHFLRQMVGAGCVGVHAGAAFDRIQTREDFNISGVVAGIHWRKKTYSCGMGVQVCGLANSLHTAANDLDPAISYNARTAMASVSEQVCGGC